VRRALFLELRSGRAVESRDVGEIELDAGASDALRVTREPAHCVLLCNIGHYTIEIRKGLYGAVAGASTMSFSTEHHGPSTPSGRAGSSGSRSRKSRRSVGLTAKTASESR
jgi:hypothetical protein